ncbi:hypothetical protein MUK42_19889, partial [Musa troglodytarum]
HYWCGRLLHREFLSPLRPSLLSVEFPPSFSRDQLIQCTAGWWKRARHHGANVSSEVGRVRKHEQELGTHHRWSVLMNNQVMMGLILLLLLLLLQGSGSQISHGHHPVNSTRGDCNDSSRIPALVQTYSIVDSVFLIEVLLFSVQSTVYSFFSPSF